MLAASKMSLSQLITAGIFGGSLIVMWSYFHWRAAVKVAFIVALLEGAIRKWLLPGGQEMVYFLKDIFLMGAYLKFFMAPDPELRAYRLNMPTTMIMVMASALVPAALNENLGSPLLALYGLKIYLYYVPLLFMMPYLFRTQKDMLRQLVWYAMIAIPICLLGMAQFRVGGDSALNVYAQQTGENVSGFGFGERIRITGTFSYITGHATFVVFFTGLSIALLAVQETRWKWIILGVSLPLLAGNAMMNGSRANMYIIGLLLAGFLVAATTGQLQASKRFTSTLLTAFLVCVAAGAYMFIDAYSNFSTRAKGDDGFYYRAIKHPLMSIEDALVAGGVGGYGIGTTHPATEGIRRALHIPAPKRKPPVYDMEVGQVIVEIGPILAICWYVLRFTVFLAVWKAFFACRQPALKPLLLFAGIITIPYMLMGVIFNHTSNLLLFGVNGLAFTSLLEPVVRSRRGNPGSRSVNQALPLPAPGSMAAK